MQAFLHNVRERKVFQYLLLIIGGAWGMIQFIDFLTAKFGWPETGVKYITLMCVVLMPSVFIFLYYNPEEGTRRKQFYFYIANVIAAALLLYFLSPALGKSYSRLSVSDDHSIAVIPFFNESQQKEENEPFCNGVMEAILNDLSQIQDLRVISRQSVEQYRNSKKTIPEIASELGVSYILAGSVQRYQNKIKVSTQLIRSDDVHLWSEEFPGEMENVFSFQDQIANQIAAALQVKIRPVEMERIERVPTTNMKALDAYNEALQSYLRLVLMPRELNAQSVSRNPDLNKEFEKGRNFGLKAVDLDPRFADAYFILTRILLYHDRESVLDSVSNYCDRGIELDPLAIDGYILKAEYFARKNDRIAALGYFGKALSINPKSYESNRRIAQFVDEPEKKLQYLYRALKIDPYSIWTPFVYHDLAGTYLSCGDFEKCEHYLKKGLSIAPRSGIRSGLLHLTAAMYISWNKPDSAIRYAQQILEINDQQGNYQMAESYRLKKDFERSNYYFEKTWVKYPEHTYSHRWGYALYRIGRREEGIKKCRKSLEELLASPNERDVAYDVAGIYSFLNQKEKSLAFLKIANWEFGLPYLIETDALFDNVRDDPRFKAIVKGIQEEKAAQRDRIRRMEETGEIFL
jgi:TolB-like protein